MNRTHTNADMSHQNTLAYKLGEVKESIRIFGLKKTLQKILRQIYYHYKGIDFETENIFNLTRTGEYVDHGTALVSTSYDFFLQVMGDLEAILEKPLSKRLFLDYGSGKGGAIIQARKYGFEEAIGVEFAKELHEIAESNIRKLSLDRIKSVWADATEFEPPKETTLIYLFNPFDAVVMERVAERIKKAKELFDSEVYLVYGNPSCDEVLEKRFEKLRFITYPTGARVSFYRV